MKLILLILAGGVTFTASLSAQKPTIAATGIFSSASYTYPGLPGSAIAQGSLFILFGTSMGPASIQYAPSLPLGPALAGTSLTVAVAGVTTVPLLVYTSAGQLCALMPSNTPAGTGTISVTYNNQTSASTPITIVASSVGIFAVNQAGSGQGVVTSLKYVANGMTSAASPGDIDIIWATGVGPVGLTGSEAAGTATLALPATPPKVYIGGVHANIVSVARSGSPGLDQIAVTVPAGVSGCQVPVVVQTGNSVSNFVTMAIGSNGVCTPSPTQPTQLQPGGSMSLGEIELTRLTIGAFSASGITIPASTTDSVSAGFAHYTYQQYTGGTGSTITSSFTNYGACTVEVVNASLTVSPTPVTVTGAGPVYLDAGTITISGPGGTKTLAPQSMGIYYGSLGGGTSGPLYFSAGSYTVAGSGGKDVGAFQTSVNLAPPTTWSNASSAANITRASGQLITWTGGDPASLTYIEGFSYLTNGTTSFGTTFQCSAKTSDQQFTIPAVVLLSLPPTPANATPFGLGGQLIVGTSGSPIQFTAAGLDAGYLLTSFATGQSVTYN